MEWPADRVARRPVADLAPYARNARTHSDAQVAQIAASITEFGFTMPVLVDNAGTLIAGHGRVLAAQKLGLTEIPCMTATDWSATKAKGYRITDNKMALLAGWDDEALAFEFGELQAEGFDLALTGFGEDEIASLMGAGGEGIGAGAGSLADRFGIPPFSVLNAREGWWQDRKRAWLALGIQSEIGRGENTLKLSAETEDYRASRGEYAKGRKPDAIPGGAGKGSVMRDMGKYRHA